MINAKKFPHFSQLDTKDCGPTCLKIVAKYYGKTISQQKLQELCETTRQGTSLAFVSEAAENIGFRTLGIKINLKKLEKEAPLPCIAYLPLQRHFVVIYKITKDKIYISDPAHDLINYNKNEFLKIWIGNNANNLTEEGIILLLEPTPKLNEIEDDEINSKIGLGFLFKYLTGYKKLIIQLILGVIVGSFLQLIIPFLTQSVVDFGIQNQNIQFVYIILLSQLFIYIGNTIIEIIRSWILMYIGARINIALISDFFIKLMKLPMAFFDSKITGDIMRRIADHERLKSLLMNAPLTIVFSLFNLIIFSIILIYYNLILFLVFSFGTIIYLSWVCMFLKKIKELDYKQFNQTSADNVMNLRN